MFCLLSHIFQAMTNSTRCMSISQAARQAVTRPCKARSVTVASFGRAALRACRHRPPPSSIKNQADDTVDGGYYTGLRSQKRVGSQAEGLICHEIASIRSASLVSCRGSSQLYHKWIFGGRVAPVVLTLAHWSAGQDYTGVTDNQWIEKKRKTENKLWRVGRTLVLCSSV